PRGVAIARACWLTSWPLLRTAALTAAWASAEPFTPPLRTRDTVPRLTPAMAATSSIVGRRLPPPRPVPIIAPAPVFRIRASVRYSCLMQRSLHSPGDDAGPPVALQGQE